MTRYLSGVSSYYGCIWNDKMTTNKQPSSSVSQLLLERAEDCRKMRLDSLLGYMYEKDATDLSQGEGYSPSVVRKARSMTVPPLQDIYEDTILYTSKWVSPSLTRKERRDRLKNQKNQKNQKKETLIDSKVHDLNNNVINNNVQALKTTETYCNNGYYSPQEKRKRFGRHTLGSLQEGQVARSFDDLPVEDEEEDFHETRKGSFTPLRPRSWSH